jgi:hypothetical protein
MCSECCRFVSEVAAMTGVFAAVLPTAVLLMSLLLLVLPTLLASFVLLTFLLLNCCCYVPACDPAVAFSLLLLNIKKSNILDYRTTTFNMVAFSFIELSIIGLFTQKN